jgi:DNA-binding response OmpR family regulator
MAEPVPDAGPAGGDGPRSVLLAEHEPEVAEMSARYLRRDGLRVRLVTTPELALAGLTGGPDAAAVLDLTMPGLDPRHIRRALRTPVIFLVAGPRPRGLGAGGARRWLGRPFSPRQLVTMVRDVLTETALAQTVSARTASAQGASAQGASARTASAQGASAQGASARTASAQTASAQAGGRAVPEVRIIGRLRLDGRSRTAIADGTQVPLTATEFAVLAAMMDHPGRVVSRRRLLAAAGREAAGDRAVDVYIAQLRAKIGSAGEIRTVRGAGYAIDPLQGGQ